MLFHLVGTYNLKNKARLTDLVVPGIEFQNTSLTNGLHWPGGCVCASAIPITVLEGLQTCDFTRFRNEQLQNSAFELHRVCLYLSLRKNWNAEPIYMKSDIWDSPNFVDL
jgi:hypothetical protein